MLEWNAFKFPPNSNVKYSLWKANTWLWSITEAVTITFSNNYHQPQALIYEKACEGPCRWFMVTLFHGQIIPSHIVSFYSQIVPQFQCKTQCGACLFWVLSSKYELYTLVSACGFKAREKFWQYCWMINWKDLAWMVWPWNEVMGYQVRYMYLTTWSLTARCLQTPELTFLELNE